MSDVIVQPIPVFPRRVIVKRPVRAKSRLAQYKIWIFLFAHIPLALSMQVSSGISTIHALVTVAVGLWWALKGRCLERVAYVAAYITGAEVIWRMTEARIFWEFGKYSTVAIFLVAILKSRRFKAPLLPLLYLVLLLPAAVMTFAVADLNDARRMVSFNLSGHIALAASIWFFSQITLTKEQFKRLLLAALGPMIGLAFLTFFFSLTISEISYGTQSNKDLSGGFGPNQVSAAIGLGALLCFICILNDKTIGWLRVLVFGVMLFLIFRSAMTFSRGGLYAAVGSAILGSVFLMRDARSLGRTILLVTLLYIVVGFVLWPQMDSLTGGKLSDRFQSTELTNRDQVVKADIEIWKENPVWGVGAGFAMEEREKYMDRTLAAHTEFSRLVAEHGVFGFSALLLLLVMGAKSLYQSRTPYGRAMTAASMGWSFLFMGVNAMRLVAPSFMFGLGFVSISSDDQDRYLSGSPAQGRTTKDNYLRKRPHKILVSKIQPVRKINEYRDR